MKTFSKLTFIIVIVTLILSCNHESEVKQVKSIIKNFDKLSAQTTMDSILHHNIDNNWDFFYTELYFAKANYELENIDSSKITTRVFPVCDLSDSFVNFKYENNILEFIEQVNPNWCEAYYSLVFYNNQIAIGELGYSKFITQKKWSFGPIIDNDHKKPNLIEKILNDPNSFLYCLAVN